jgi:hypothetical protein
MIIPNQYRVRAGHLATDNSFGANGNFIIPHYKIVDYYFNCIIRSGMGWEHVSVSLIGKKKPITRCPTWEEMCFIKSQFWSDDEAVMQLHPPKKDWVNNHPYCLHLWRPQFSLIPLPPSDMVGIKDMNTETNKTLQ